MIEMNLEKMTPQERKNFENGLRQWEASCMAEIDLGEMLENMWIDYKKSHIKGDD